MGKPSSSSVSVRLDQWADGPTPDGVNNVITNEAFVNGNLNQTKAHYAEGDSIPYRAVLDDLTTNTEYSLTIQWDTVDSGAYAIDYLTGFNFSFEGTKHPGEPDVTPLVNDVSGGGALHTIPIPADSQLLTGFGDQFGETDGLASGQPSGEQLIAVFGNVTNLDTSDISYNADLTKASITVSFTYLGSTANNEDSVVVAWGGHIASSLDWGGTVETASDISGSPYHTRVLTLSENGVTKSIGNQDRSLSASAVIAPPVADDVSLLADEDDITGGNDDDQTGDDDQSGVPTGALPVTEATSVNFADLDGDAVLDTLGNAVSSSGTELTFFWDGASRTLYASRDTDSLLDAQATAAFKIQVTASSPFNYTFTLVDQVDHPDTGNTNTEDPNIVIDLTYTAVGAGGSDTGVVQVTIDDDVPLPLEPADLSVQNTAGATADAALGAFGNVGADEPGSSVFVGSDGSKLEGTIQDSTQTLEFLKSGGSDIFLFGFGTDTLTATTDPDASNGLDPTKQVFVMTLNPDGSVAANDTYDITMTKPIDNLVDIEFGDITASPASGNPDTLVVNDIGGSTIDTLFKGFVDVGGNPGAQTTVNVSGAGVGVGTGQDFNFNANGAGTADDQSDRMRIDFFDDADNDDIIDSGEAVTVNEFSFLINQNNASNDDADVLLKTYDGATQDDIDRILINGTELDLSVPGSDVDGVTFELVAGGGVILHGLEAPTDEVTVITDDGYNRIDISGIGNDDPKDTFDILLGGVAVPSPFDIVFDTQANLTDADGDTTTPSQLEVTLLAP
jgi:hypothetical protein